MTPTGTGAYEVVFSGLTVFFGGHMQIAARQDPNTTCQVQNWTPATGNLRINVRCYDEAGLPANAQFVVSAFFGAAPDPGNPNVALDFDSFTGGTLLGAELYETHGLRFSRGVEVVECDADTFECSRSRSAHNVVAPVEVPEEFRRDELRMTFAHDQNEVAVSLNAALLDGQEREVTMEAKAISGFTLGTVTDVVRGDPAWATRLRIAAPGIRRVYITSRLVGADTDDNQIILDDLYYTDTTPAPPDESLPILLIMNISEGDVLADSSLNYTVIARENVGFDIITTEVVRVSDGAAIQPLTTLCGTSGTGVCPAIFEQDLSVGLTAPGDYRVTATATDEAGNTATKSVTVMYEPPPPPPPAFVHKVEFNQSVTNRLYDRNISLPQDVFIIPGKDLLIRYYLHSEDEPRADFTASLRLEIEKGDGTAVSRTLSPNAGSSRVDLMPLPEDTGSARRDSLVAMRTNLSRTLNFVIPGDWFEDAVFTEIELWEGLINLSRAQIHDTRDNSSTLALQLVFVNDQQFLRLGRDNFEENVLPYLEYALPYGDIQILSERGANFNGQVFLDLSPCAHLKYMLSLYSADFGPTGLPTGSRVWWSKGIFAMPEDLYGDDCVGIGQVPGRNFMSQFIGGTAAHEIGHNTGLEHASNAHGEAGGGGFTPWPYYHGAMGNPGETFGVILNATTPPGDGMAGEWEPFLIDPCPTSDFSQRFAPGGCALMDDTTHVFVPHEMMSYGIGAGLEDTIIPETRGRWPSVDTYMAMYGRGRTYSPSPAPAMVAAYGGQTEMFTAAETEDGPIQVLVVTGIIKADGAAHVLPMVGRAATMEELSIQEPGPYLIELLGEDNAVLASASTVESALADGEGEMLFIQAMLPYVQNARRVRITREGVMVMEKAASLHAPTVRVQYPNGAEHFNGDRFEIRWEGNDADGDDLTYVVEYSPDNGAKWETIRVVTPGESTAFEVLTEGLLPGIRARIRVTASDGINVSQDESNGYFSVGPAPPVTSYDIYAVNAATGTSQRLTFLDETDEYNPDWSPDGMHIVHDVTTFDSEGAITSQDLYLTDLTTSNSVPLVGGAGGNDAAWHPDGSQLLFDRCPLGSVPPQCEASLYRIPALGGIPTLIREDAIDGDWAQTGKLIVFHQPSDGSIRTRHLVSGREARIAAHGINPVWTSDDKYVIYSSEGNLFRIRVNGSGKPKGRPMLLTDYLAHESQPSASPSGNSIVFHSDQNGDFDVFTLSEDGTIMSLTGVPGAGDFDPAYSTDGEQVAYARFTGAMAGSKQPRASASNPSASSERVEDKPLEASSYPNPFNPVTTIRFTLPQASDVSVRVYDILGRQVATLLQGPMEAGTHGVRFEAGDLPSGTYFYRINTGRQRVVKQLILLK